MFIWLNVDMRLAEYSNTYFTSNLKNESIEYVNIIQSKPAL